MYNKATYITPYKIKIARALGIPAKDLKPNMVYAILANAKIKPLDHDKYGTPLYSYQDMDALVKSYPIIRDAYNKWKEDMIRQDVESELRKDKKPSGYSVNYKWPNKNTAEQERRKEMERASDELLRAQEVYFNDDDDDRLYESLFSKKVYLTEKQIDYIKQELLNEDRGSKNLHQVRAYIQQEKPSMNAQQVIDALRHDIPNIRLPRINNTDYYQFALGVARMYLNGELSDADTILSLNNVLKYVASNAHIKEYDKNLNNLTAKQLIDRFSSIVAQDIEQSKQALSQQEYNKSDYKIVPIDNFETAEQYGDYVSWCVTHDDGMYNNYTHNGLGRFYFCLKPGFENVPEEKGEGCPLDEYGLSMIAVSINPDGSPNTITCRWNHDNGGNDSVMTPEELSNVIGYNFYDVFKPYTEEEIKAKRAELLETFKYNYREDRVVTNGPIWEFVEDRDKENKWEDYRVVYNEDMYGDATAYSIAVVNSPDDMYSNADPDNSHLVIDEIFDWVSPEANKDGLVAVGYDDGRTNYLNITTGKYITDQWFALDKNHGNRIGRQISNVPIMDDGGVIIKDFDETYNILMPNGERLIKDWQTHNPIKYLKHGLYVVSDGLAKLRVYNTLTNQTQDLHGLPDYGLAPSGLIKLTVNGYNFIYKIIDNNDTLVVPLNKSIPAVAFLGFYSFTNNDSKIVQGYKIKGKDKKEYILDLNRIGDTYIMEHPNPNDSGVYTIKYIGNEFNGNINIMNENKKQVYFTESQMRYINERIYDNPESKYIENDYDEKWEKLPINSDIFKTISRRTSFRDNCYSKIGLMDVAEVREEDVEDGDGVHYIAMFYGGLNGSGEWDKYLKDITKIIQSIKGSYIINLDVDVLDDGWTLTIGFRKEKLNEGASGYQPEDSDAYFDTCYKVSEELFKDLLKKLDNCYRDKDDNMIYTYLGVINHLLQVECLRKPVYYTNKDLTSKNPEGNPLGMDIIKTCLKCYKYLESDKENRQGWKDFERYKEELYGQYHVFKMTMQTLNQDANIYPNYLYHLNESNNFVEPQKVLLVKKYLDDNFVRAAIPVKMGNGDIVNKAIVGYKGPDGQPAENLSIRNLFWKTQDRFKSIYADKNKRDTFLKQVITDWYNKKISKDGLLSVNKY